MIIDVHIHLGSGSPSEHGRADKLVHFAERMGIDRLCLSSLNLGKGNIRNPTPEEMRRLNDITLEEMKRHPGVIVGFVYVTPDHVEASLEEIERCVVNDDMRAIKLWTAQHCTNESVFPIIERAMELDVPVQQHTWLKITGNLEGESTPQDMAELAARYPEAKFFMSHVGGDWELGVKCVKPFAHVYADIAGGDPEAGIVETAVRELGAERVVFGSDALGRSYASQLAKVQGAEIEESEKVLILGENARKWLRL